MKLTGPGKLVFFILVLGIAFGGWNAWQRSQGKAGGTGGGGFQMPKLPDVLGNRDTSTSNGGGAGSGSNEIELVSSPSKKGWLNEQIGKFNAANAGKYKVKFTPLETREAMHAILDGTVKPAIYCPSTTIWTTRLQEAWQAKAGKPILNLDDPMSYRVFFRTPLVFLTTRSKAGYVRAQLGASNGWENLRALNLGRKRAPWGRIKWAHADPLNANSGMMTLGLILARYAEASGQSGALQSVSNSPRFRTYMRELSRGLIYELPAESGTSALTKDFVDNPDRYDFITTYENSALEVVAQNPNLAVAYPNPTVVSEHVVAILQGDWLSENQKQGALEFMKFLGTQSSLRDGVKYRFRPVSGGSSNLQAEITRLRDAGFQQSFSSVELPPYEALNAAAFQWRIHIAKKPAQ